MRIGPYRPRMILHLRIEDDPVAGVPPLARHAVNRMPPASPAVN